MDATCSDVTVDGLDPPSVRNREPSDCGYPAALRPARVLPPRAYVVESRSRHRRHTDAETVNVTESRAMNDRDEVVLSPEGYAKLTDEHRRLTTINRPEAAARLAQALEVAGDPADNPEHLDARAELDLVEERIELLERRLSAARVLRPDGPSSNAVVLGSHVVLEDLDDGARQEFTLVSSAESNPAEGRLSQESPVGRAIAGHRRGDVVDAHAPHRIRHLRIAEIGVTRQAA